MTVKVSCWAYLPGWIPCQSWWLCPSRQECSPQFAQGEGDWPYVPTSQYCRSGPEIQSWWRCHAQNDVDKMNTRPRQPLFLTSVQITNGAGTPDSSVFVWNWLTLPSPFKPFRLDYTTSSQCLLPARTVDGSSDSNVQTPGDTVSDSDPGSVDAGPSPSDTNTRDSDWDTEDEINDDLSESGTEFRAVTKSEESSLFFRYATQVAVTRSSQSLSFLTLLINYFLTKSKFKNHKDRDGSVQKYFTMCLTISNMTSGSGTSLNTLKWRGMLSKTCWLPKGLCLPSSSVLTRSFSAYETFKRLVDSTFLSRLLSGPASHSKRTRESLQILLTSPFVTDK